MGRLAGPDGIRGFAAFWVVLYHMWGAIQRRETHWVPIEVQHFLNNGFLGVDVFFILSGFIIAYSVIGKPVDRFFIPRFILRRSVRIDPPYWFAIGLAIIFIVMKNHFFVEHKEPLPSFGSIFAHIFYLQDLLEFNSISSVFWTLCLEFQFYILFSFGVFLFNRYGFLTKCSATFSILVVSIFFMIASPWIRFTEDSMPFPGTIIPYLYEFILGIFVCQYVRKKIDHLSLIILTLTVFFSTALYKTAFHALIPLVTVLALVGSSKGWFVFKFLFSKPFR